MTKSNPIPRVEIGTAFRSDTQHQKFVGLTGTPGRDIQLGIEGTRTPLVALDPLPVGWQQWQADHILDLGMLTYIAKQNAPSGIIEDDWQKITDAIIGNEDASPRRYRLMRSCL